MIICIIIQYIDIYILYVYVYFIVFRIIRKISMSFQKSNYIKFIVKDEENDVWVYYKECGR